MEPTTDRERAAFYQFLDHLRDDSFSMFERVRRIERGERDGLPMCERLHLLGEIGLTAGRMSAEIEMIYGALSQPLELEQPELRAALHVA